MNVTALLYTILAAATVGAAASVPVLDARDTCGPGYAGDQRRTNSPCQASNGDRHFCGCDRTGVQHASPDPSPVPYAFATILTGEGDTESEVESHFFTAALLLTYQLLHNPDTRSADDIPLLVLVTENIPQEQRTTLTKDGTLVIPVENITREWVTKYTKIAFLDADPMLFERIDGIFTEEGGDTLVLPPTYMVAHIHDLWVEQNLPPTRDSGKDVYVRDNCMNAGFFVLAPPETVFDYYLALLDQPGSFDPNYPEQNLLTCAHRDGRMP
ncbi:hypothetical protein BJX68DRAFT_266918 [Aspergillus pseudodeflectus]|uniref:Nucleotide-diphospho-sugar transferase n=1 Tax=Aspergillus pseudodeflectus TaxID=176178 RepID=A0ABR4KCX0_9EURO